MSELLKLHRRFCDYSLVFKGNTRRTIQWFEETIGYVGKQTGATRVEEITRRKVEEWIFRGKTERNWSAKTIRSRLQSLSSFVDWCVDEGYLKENPVKKISKPKLPKRLPKHLTQEQALSLIEWAQNFPYKYRFERTRTIAIIATFIFTGVRLNELRNLKMYDVDLRNRSLSVNGGKGDKDRIIPLNLRLIEVLEDYLKDRERLNKSCLYFFTSMRSDTKMGDLVIKRIVEKLRVKSGIYFYPHMLRHTFATLMLEGGCDLFSLSKMMGHSDIKTTTIYLSATVSHLQGQIMKHPLNSF